MNNKLKTNALIVFIIANIVVGGVIFAVDESCTYSWYGYTTEGIGNAMEKYPKDTWTGRNLRRYIASRSERDPEWRQELLAYLMRVNSELRRKTESLETLP